MAFDEQLNNKIREIMLLYPNVEEKHMFGGTCFMLNGKMCVGMVKDEMMCRIDPAVYDEALQQHGCREMDFTGKPMKGYVYVSADALRTKKQLSYWIGLCVAFNERSKAAPKRRPGKK
jgi:TfoX/Sxy family transcriptional regulator of competence genes